MRVLSKIYMLFVLLVGTLGFADEYHYVSNDAEVVAEISLFESNRISVKGDRIASMVSNTLSWQLDHNETTGDLFLIPNIYADATPLNLFVTTEKQHTYKLILMPMEMPSAQVILYDNTINSNITPADYGQNFYSALSDTIKNIAVGDVHLPKPDLPDGNQIVQGEVVDISLTGFMIRDGFVFYKGIMSNPTLYTINNLSDRFPFSNKIAIWLERQQLGTNQSSAFVLVAEYRGVGDGN